MLDAAQQSVVSNCRASTLGNTNSFLDGRSPHSKTPIYALDRMYSVDGKDVHRIRALADGTQLMLNPKGDEILRRFGKNVKGKSPEHYVKQKNEIPRLVPGDPKHVAVVHLIFRLVYIEPPITSIRLPSNSTTHWRTFSASEWDGGAIKRYRQQPYLPSVFSGRGQRLPSAIYYKTAKAALCRPSNIGAEELRDKSGRVRTRARPYEEWLLREDPALVEFLPKHVYEIARPAIEAQMREEGKAKPLPPLSKDRHRNSDFFLKNFLTSKQGGYPMTGKRSGRQGEKRYYRVARGQRFPRTNGIYNRAINATALETEMLRVLREVLLNKADLKDALRPAPPKTIRRSSSRPTIVRRSRSC